MHFALAAAGGALDGSSGVSPTPAGSRSAAGAVGRSVGSTGLVRRRSAEHLPIAAYSARTKQTISAGGTVQAAIGNSRFDPRSLERRA